MNDSCIDVVSTSSMTADTSPVVLKSTERFRFRFMPMIVDNQNIRNKLFEESYSLNESLKTKSTFLLIVLNPVKKLHADRQKMGIG